MNKSPDATLIQDYLDELPLDQAQQQEPAHEVELAGGSDVDAIHVGRSPRINEQMVSSAAGAILRSQRSMHR